jgi:site-specific recombinase XerC
VGVYFWRTSAPPNPPSPRRAHPQGLESFLERRGSNATWVAERQVAVREWYAWWMHQTALRFEAILDMRFQKRMREKRDESAEALEAQVELEEADAILSEEMRDEEERSKVEDAA